MYDYFTRQYGDESTLAFQQVTSGVGPRLYMFVLSIFSPCTLLPDFLHLGSKTKAPRNLPWYLKKPQDGHPKRIHGCGGEWAAAPAQGSQAWSQESTHGSWVARPQGRHKHWLSLHRRVITSSAAWPPTASCCSCCRSRTGTTATSCWTRRATSSTSVSQPSTLLFPFMPEAWSTPHRSRRGGVPSQEVSESGFKSSFKA